MRVSVIIVTKVYLLAYAFECQIRNKKTRLHEVCPRIYNYAYTELVSVTNLAIS